LLQEGKRLKDKLSRLEESERLKPVTRVTNSASEKYVLQRFQREFDRIISEMYSDFTPENIAAAVRGEDESVKLNYIRFKELLVRLGMTTEATEEAGLTLELWQAMERQEEVTLKDAWTAILIILRVESKKSDENSARL